MPKRPNLVKWINTDLLRLIIVLRAVVRFPCVRLWLRGWPQCRRESISHSFRPVCVVDIIPVCAPLRIINRNLRRDNHSATYRNCRLLRAFNAGVVWFAVWFGSPLVIIRANDDLAVWIFLPHQHRDGLQVSSVECAYDAVSGGSVYLGASRKPLADDERVVSLYGVIRSFHLPAAKEPFSAIRRDELQRCKPILPPAWNHHKAAHNPRAVKLRHALSCQVSSLSTCIRAPPQPPCPLCRVLMLLCLFCLSRSLRSRRL